MNIYPAIDLKNSQVVRLKQGDFAQVTQYSSHPLEIAQKWESSGAPWLHMVDLDAALSGKPENLEIIQDIASQVKMKIQVGGGIRNLSIIESYLNAGVSRCVIGTQAVKDPDFLNEAGKAFPQQVALGLDTQGDFVAIHGWTEQSTLKVEDMFARIDPDLISCIIHTEIERDGLLVGLPIDKILAFIHKSPIPIIVSGGVSKIDDIKNLSQHRSKKLEGVIIGKALYENRIDLKEAVQISQEKS